MISVRPSLSDLATPDWWLRREAGILVGLFALAVALTGVAMLSGWYKFLPFLLLPSAPGAWMVWRMWFLSRGPKRRVGIAIEGVAIPADELRETRRSFLSIAEDLDHELRLIWLPEEWVSTKQRAAEVAERHALSLVGRICVSRRKGVDDGRSIDIELHRHFTEQINRDLVKSEIEPLNALLNSQKSPLRGFDERKFVARSVLEAILLHIATKYVNDHDYASAGVLLEALDQTLAERGLGVDHQPRRAFRFMIMSCSRAMAIHRASKAFGSKDVVKLSNQLNRTVDRYAAEFPEILITAARASFIAGNIEEAAAHATRLEREAPSPDLKGFAHLALAPLRLFSSNYAAANHHFDEFLKAKISQNIDWDDLIDFADSCLDQGYSNAIFMCCFYRVIRQGATVSDKLRQRYEAWMAEDPERVTLNGLMTKYHWTVGAGKPEPRAKSGASPRSGGFKKRKPKKRR